MPISEFDIDDLDRIKPLWQALHAHHCAIAPQLAPYVEPDQSWDTRRAVYTSLLSQGGKIFVVTEGNSLVSYASAQSSRMPWPATFQTSPQVLELTGLFVKPEYRSKGIGIRLLAAVDDFAKDQGLSGAMVGIVHGNTPAANLYASMGFVPACSLLTNFGRPIVRQSKNPPALIRPLLPEEVDQLRGAWLQVHHHHQAVAPHIAPYVSDDHSWEIFKPTFHHAAAEGLLLGAEVNGALVGFTCAEIIKNTSDFTDTWKTGTTIAEIEVMAVNEGARGQGIGSAMLECITDTLGQRGITDVCIGAFEGNTGAMRLYERAGFRVAWHDMTRFSN